MSGRDMPRGALRVPPHSAEAEQSVLGALLIDNRAWDRVGDLLVERDFYVADHAAIYRAIGGLVNAGKPADVVTVYERLGSAGDDVGGVAYLNDLAQCVPSASNARRYAEIVRERSMLRQLVRVADELTGAAMQAGEEGGDPLALADKTMSDLLAMVQGRRTQEPVSIESVMTALIDEVNALAEGKSPAISSGLPDLDEATAGGGRPGELWVLGARPSMGKSALILTISLAVAQTGWVLFLTQEDSKLTLAQRAVANVGRVNLADLRNPARARDPEAMWTGIGNGVDDVAKRHMLVDDQGGLTLADVRRKLQQAGRMTGGKLRLVVVDYLQLMTGDNDNRNQMLGEVANGLKALAKEFGVWVVLLSQLSRKADERTGPPHLSDLRDSGDIEGAGDVVALLHREARRKLTESNKHWAQLEVAKNKNGATCTVNLFFDGKHQRFASWEGAPPTAQGPVGKVGRTGGMN